MLGPSHFTSKVRAIQPNGHDVKHQINGEQSRTLMHVSQSLARPGDFDRAHTLYEQVLRARPYRELLFHALNNLALLHDTSGNLERAEET